MSDEVIQFVCTVEKVQTLTTTNTIRVWIELPETALYEMARLAECKVRGQILEIVATPIAKDNLDNVRKTYV